jgi:hypothetical protein
MFRVDHYGNNVDEDGVPIVESGKPAAIDHDLDQISAAFEKWATEQRLTFLSD